MSLVSIGLKSTGKNLLFFNPAFCRLLIVKVFETFPIHSV